MTAIERAFARALKPWLHPPIVAMMRATWQAAEALNEARLLQVDLGRKFPNEPWHASRAAEFGYRFDDLVCLLKYHPSYLGE